MKRIEWIDSLKGFGIFCVTFGHLSCNYLLETHIYSFHMFLFFFLSGFLHNNSQGSFRKYISKKTKALFVPFMLWNILSCLVGLLLKNTVSETIRLFFLLDGVICWNAPIWFLLLLFMAEIVFFFIEKYIPYGKYLSIPVLLLLWIFASGTNIFLKLNILPVCLLFYIFGNIFKQFYDKYNEKIIGKYRYAIPAAVLFFSINIVFGLVLNERITFTGANFGNAIYCCLAAIAGVLFYVVLFRTVPFLKANKWLSYLGRNSLIIMATQYWFFAVYDAVSERFFDLSIREYRNTAKALAMSVVTILLIIAIVELLRKIGTGKPRFKKMCSWFGVNMSKE